MDESRSRVPDIHGSNRVLEGEPEAIESAYLERERYLRISEALESFRDRLRASDKTFNAIERQEVLRSLV